MVQPAGELNLALEAGQGLLVALLDVEQFDGRGALEHGVVGQIDHAHATFAQFLVQRVLPEAFGNQGGALGLAIGPGDDRP